MSSRPRSVTPASSAPRSSERSRTSAWRATIRRPSSFTARSVLLQVLADEVGRGIVVRVDLAADVDGDDVRPVLRHTDGVGPALPPRRPGDEGDLALYASSHVVLLVLKLPMCRCSETAAVDRVHLLAPGPGDDEDVDVTDRRHVLPTVAPEGLRHQTRLGPQVERRRAVLGIPFPVRRSVPPAPLAPPWITVVTLMSSSRTSCARTSAKASRAASGRDVHREHRERGCRVDSLEVFTMSPPPAARSRGMADRQVWTGPAKFVAICC